MQVFFLDLPIISNPHDALFFVSGLQVQNYGVPTNPEFGVNTIRITITQHCKNDLATRFSTALSQIRYTNLEYDFVDLRVRMGSEVSASSSTANEKPTNKICAAIDLVKRAMEKLNPRRHRGYIYKKVPNGECTLF